MSLKASISIISILFMSITGAAQTIIQPNFHIKLPIMPETGRDTVSLLVIGDVMMHSKQMEYDYRTFLENIKSAPLSADFAAANMEFSLGGLPYSGYPAFSAPDGYEEYVADCGFNIFLMANNHLLDRREAGLTRTLDRYRSMSGRITCTGAAADEKEMIDNYPLMLNRHGIRIALINFAYGSNVQASSQWPTLYYTDKDRIAEAIRRARDRGADFVVALPHWGIEYQLVHSKEQEELAHWLVSQGTDAIVGSHPHVVQDSTHIDGVPVIYSVGNAISNMSAENTRLEIAVTLRFIREKGEKIMLEPEIRFMWCSLPGRLTDSYSTIFVDEWIGRRREWKDPGDYDNMINTLKRVQDKNSIGK